MVHFVMTGYGDLSTLHIGENVPTDQQIAEGLENLKQIVSNGSEAPQITHALTESDFVRMVENGTKYLVLDPSDLSGSVNKIEQNFPTLFVCDVWKRPGNREYTALVEYSLSILEQLPGAESASKKYLEANDYKVYQEGELLFELETDTRMTQELAPSTCGGNVAGDVITKAAELARRYGSWQTLLDKLEEL